MLTQGYWSQAYAGLALSRNYIYGNTIDEVLGFEWVVDGTPSIWYYYLHDHLYSPAAMLTEWGIAERYEYDAYGRRSVMTPGFDHRSNSHYLSDLGLTGREIDELDRDATATPRLQHMHYRHRDYSPKLGRFMQHDPIDLIFLQYYTNPMVLSLLIQDDTRYMSIKTYANESSIKNDMLIRITLIERYGNRTKTLFGEKGADFRKLGPHFFLDEDLSISVWHDYLGYEAGLYQYVESSPINLLDALGLTHYSAAELCDLFVYRPCIVAFGPGNLRADKVCREAEATCWIAVVYGGATACEAIQQGKDMYIPELPGGSVDYVGIVIAIVILGFVTVHRIFHKNLKMLK